MGPTDLLTLALRDGHTFPTSAWLRQQYIHNHCRFGKRDLDILYDEGQIAKVQGEPASLEALWAEARIASWLASRSITSMSVGWRAAYPPEASLNPSQRAAWEGLSESHTAVLTGGPGTGKTYLLSYLLQTWVQAGKLVAVAAPTGKAASVMALRLGLPVLTVHFLLGMVPGQVSASKEVTADVLVVDESTMLDSVMFAALCDAVGEKTKVILVGDPDQLPPVSYGQPFQDIVRLAEHTERVAHFSLTANMRTDQAGIIELLDYVRRGELPPKLGAGVSHFRTTPNAAVDLAMDLPRLARRFPGIERKDVLLLTGLRQEKFAMGTEAINHFMSNRLVKERIQGQKFALGDRVMFTVNDRYHGFVNGELGVLHAWGDKGRTVEITSDSGVEYKLIVSDCQTSLEWAYAMTVHKAQGSQARVVLFPLEKKNLQYANRRLVYTAMSRAQEHLALFGDLDLLLPALRRDVERQTLLGRVDLDVLAALKPKDAIKSYWQTHGGEYVPY